MVLLGATSITCMGITGEEMKEAWTLVNTNVFDDTYRMITIGGWIVKVVRQDMPTALLFVPDKDHKWKIE